MIYHNIAVEMRKNRQKPTKYRSNA